MAHTSLRKCKAKWCLEVLDERQRPLYSVLLREDHEVSLVIARAFSLATFFKPIINRFVILGDEHKTVLLSILATVLAGVVIFIVTIAVAGGISISLLKSYVLPLFMSAFTLSIFWGFLFARHKGKLSILAETEPPKDEKASTAPKSTG